MVDQTARKKAGRKKFLKLSRFDKDVAKLIQSGVIRLEELTFRLGVDPAAARERLTQLVEKNLLVFDPNSSGYRLGVEGYNKFAPRLKKTPANLLESTPKENLLEKPVSAVISTPRVDPSFSGLSLSSAETPLDVLAVLEASRKALDQPTQKTKVAPLEKIDLSALLEKGRAGSGARGGEWSGTADTSGKPYFKPGEQCELCRAPFKISVKEPKLAKFTHCVCGSAYHKDCYDSLIQQGGRCARCGRKLSSVLDASSEESLQNIKDAFE